MEKKVLITGGAGFIGSHLCEALLDKNFQVICVDNLITGQKKNINHLLSNPRFKFIKADVAKKSDYPAFNSQFSLILHFASPAGPNPESPLSYLKMPIKTYLANSLGTHYLLKLARKHKASFLFASTSEVYGDPQIHPQKETYVGHVNPIGPRSCYDESKRFGEMAAITFIKKYGLRAQIVRIFNTYGPRMNPKDGRAIPLFITQALESKPITIFGSGKQTRSFCYIDDLVKGILKITDKNEKGSVYNIGDPNEISINEAVSKIIQLTNSQSKIIHKPALKDDPKKRCPDINKAKKELNWQPKIGLKEGLLKTINYFKKLT